ncbi:MAG: hypothetical protein LBH32_10410 [Dysgonamonadaceae bacterium]|jgi:hypothetical protein|nr:hypothetical protein [Dysgonamonadaceae bacterium]
MLKKDSIMLKYNWIFLISMFPVYISGQTTVTSDEYLVTTVADSYQWAVNGVMFKPMLEETVIYPNRQGFDTILFWDKRSHSIPDTIFGKIPENQEYLMTVGCCNDGFNMHRIKKDIPAVNYDSLDEETADSMYRASREYGQIKFVVLNKPDADTLICIYGSIVCLSGQMITVEKDYEWLSPCITGHSSDIDYVIIAKKKETLLCEHMENTGMGIDMVSLDGELNTGLYILKKFGLRLFNKKRLIIEFDYLTKKLELILN